MRTNPILDSLHYILTFNAWTTPIFDLLLLAGIVIALQVFRTMPEQRSARHLYIAFARLVMGSMWWLQVIWKTPPTYGGLQFWTSEMVKYASTDLQRWFLKDVVLGHFSLFAPQVFLTEVIIAVTLLLGVWTRLGAILAFAMGLNLSLGLYRSPGEWPWTYVFLILISGLFIADPPGRSLGLDVLLAKRDTGGTSLVARLLRLAR